MELGKDTETSVVEDIMQKQKPNQCASLVYTVRCYVYMYLLHCGHSLCLYVYIHVCDYNIAADMVSTAQNKTVTYCVLWLLH
jgi:hypothetical protein